MSPSSSMWRPCAFFHPVDRHNERLEELLRTPRSSRSRGGLTEFQSLLDAFEEAVASNPATRFVAAHGLHVENLSRVSGLLDRYPNLFIDIAGHAPELGASLDPLEHFLFATQTEYSLERISSR